LINRNAITIKYKKPFLDWIAKTGKPFLETGNDDYNIYLIPEVEGDEELEEIILDNWDTIFNEELENWCTDKSLWPQDLSYDLFKEWVIVDYHSVVHDLGYDEVDDPEFNSRATMDRPVPSQIFAKLISGGQTGADQ
jgi:hypothetical protein